MKTTNCFFRRIRSVTVALALSGLPFGANAVTVQESFDPVSNTGEYWVYNEYVPDLPDPEPIYAVVVANDLATDAYPDTGCCGPQGFWDSALIQRSEWESNTSPFGLDASGWAKPDTSLIPWEDFFSGYSQVVAYWAALDLDLLENSSQAIGDSQPFHAYGDGQPIGAGENALFFFESLIPASPFVAFGQDGSVIASGETSFSPNVVPVPAAVWLFGSGLLVLAGRVRRAH